MRFIVDAQLPPALARWLAAHEHEAEHVFDLEMTSAKDGEIWAYAKERDAVILTKDEDFVTLRYNDAAGPCVVWIRVGNVTRRYLLEWFSKSFPAIEESLTSGERLVEVS